MTFNQCGAFNVIFTSVLYQFCIILGIFFTSLRRHFGINSASFLRHFCVIFVSFLCHFCVIFASFFFVILRHFCVISASFLCHFASFLRHFCVISASVFLPTSVFLSASFRHDIGVKVTWEDVFLTSFERHDDTHSKTDAPEVN